LDACAAEASAAQARVACETTEAAALSALKDAQARADDVERRWRASRALSLAATLEPGRPCPVCGSTEHPSPATASGEGADDRALDEARTAAAKARDRYEQAREESARARSAHAAAQMLQRSIREEPGPGTELSLADAEAAVTAGQIELERLLEQADAGDLMERVSECEQALTAAAAAAKSAAETAADARDTSVRAEERLNARAAAVPEELREEGALEAALESARAHEQALEAALREAQEAERKATQRRIASETAAAGATESENKASEAERSSREEFQALLPANRFADENEWRDCLLDEERRTALAREIDDFQGQLLRAEGRLQQAEAALAGQPEPEDIERLRAEADEAKLEQTRAIERHSEAKSQLDKLSSVADGLADIDARAAEVRAAYQTVGILSEVAGGQNPSRVSFQRWVLGVYLDEVLAVASRRLYLMSKGRYRLERQREIASHGRPSGLDLAVFDEFSGTSRAAVTLSGGESFLAALALALGLAETVQEHSAATPLETIFVDEGFGALDADALELAVDALMELQMSGRLVGVISHVAELRQVIPARLEVRGGSAGSSTRFIVP